MSLLSKLTREELENKLLHIVEFTAYQLATEFIQRTEKEAAIIRTPEAEEENDERVKQLMHLINPAWDVVELTHPGYEYMKDWVKTNVEKTKTGDCTCAGCKPVKAVVN